jgi:4'-phosphopantetheinyl transferase
VAPDQLRFDYSNHGKPKLAKTFGQGRLSFNLSHSGGLALYSVTLGREIGIDLERVWEDLEYEQIAERFFSPREGTMLRRLPARQRPEAFFNCWTRKEAYLKARGEGLSLPLNQFDVSMAPGEPAALLNVWDDPQEATRWTLQELIPAPGYVGALAVEGHAWRLTRWRWPD